MPMDEINALKDCFVRTLSPQRIYLFGSYAVNRQHEDSDLDFYIVVDDAASDLPDLTFRAYKAARSIKRRPIDILVGTRNHFETRKLMPSAIERAVYQEGVLLYDA